MNPRRRNGYSGSAALILLAPDFREGRTVYCLERLRQAGISVSLVGLSTGLICGYHGMMVRPDLTISELLVTTDPKLVLIPDGKECAAALFADPRTVQLIQRTLASEGFVAAMPAAEVLLETAGLVTASNASHFVWRGGKDLETFTTELINYLG